LVCGGCIVGAGIIGSTVEPEKTPQKVIPRRTIKKAEPDAPAEKPIAKSKVSKENFGRISIGMTKSEVVDILGSDYEVLSENRIGQGTKFDVHTEMIMWKASGFSAGNCNIIFQNDKVTQKSQFALP
jgi:hypothetical protein